MKHFAMQKTRLPRENRIPPMRARAWAKHLRRYGCLPVRVRDPKKYLHASRT